MNADFKRCLFRLDFGLNHSSRYRRLSAFIIAHEAFLGARALVLFQAFVPKPLGGGHGKQGGDRRG
jgi:hypothetical protein